MRYGAESPAPTVSRIRMVRAGLVRTEANPTAGARNGAVHEVASSVVSSPLKNAPAEPCLDAKVVAAVSAPELKVTSKTPNRFSAIKVTSTVMMIRKYGLANWKPQPAA